MEEAHLWHQARSHQQLARPSTEAQLGQGLLPEYESHLFEPEIQAECCESAGQGCPGIKLW